MNINVAGVGLVLITFFMCVAMIFGNKWIRKVTNCYFFWLGIGLFWLIWLLAFRFIPDWINYTNLVRQGYFTDPANSYEQSIAISKAFLMDVCPFAALATCVTIIVDPTRKLARSFCPIALLGGIITIFAMIFDSSALPSAEISAHFIFIGDYPNRCYFIMHFIQILIPIGIMLNTPRGGWKGWVLTLILAIAIYGYVAICMACTGCRWNCSGLSLNDWESGEYAFACQLFGFPVNIAPFIGIPLLFVADSIFITLKDYVFSRWIWKYGNAYSGKWYMWYNFNEFVKQKIL